MSRGTAEPGSGPCLQIRSQRTGAGNPSDSCAGAFKLVCSDLDSPIAPTLSSSGARATRVWHSTNRRGTEPQREPERCPTEPSSDAAPLIALEFRVPRVEIAGVPVDGLSGPPPHPYHALRPTVKPDPPQRVATGFALGAIVPSVAHSSLLSFHPCRLDSLQVALGAAGTKWQDEAVEVPDDHSTLTFGCRGKPPPRHPPRHDASGAGATGMLDPHEWHRRSYRSAPSGLTKRYPTPCSLKM